jgi:hypothetical protein
VIVRNIKIIAVVFVLAVGILSTRSAQAQKTDEKKRTTIDFEDELIQGEVKKPELFYLMQKKQFNFKRLIKLRTDFIPEMRRSSEEIRRSGSAD